VAKGRFPQNREEWLEIPGVGDYTAGAILSIAGNLPEPILDGNVERVLSRIRRVSRQNGDSHFKARLWKLSQLFVETSNRNQIAPSNLNQALMELGAMVCTPKKPHCLLCPVQELCRAYESGEQEAFPPKKKPKQWLQVKENLHCVFFGSEWVLLRQRKKGEWRAGLWDLLDSDPKELFPMSTFLGEVETRHIVTRHKISRKTQLWQLAGKAKGKLDSAPTLAAAKEADQTSSYRWVSVHDPDVAVGSALKRTLRAATQVMSPKAE
jgi:A/G-specific adenine glycosylase